MSSILRGTPKVLVIQETSVQPGRDKLQGIFNYVHLFGPWHLHLIQSRASERKIRALSDWNSYDGVIVDQLAMEMGDALRLTFKPVVLTAHFSSAEAVPSGVPRACVMEDSRSIGEAAADYFIRRDYKHFAYLGDPHGRSWSIQRGEAFSRCVADAGFTFSSYSARPTPSGWRDERPDLQSWLQELPKPVALLAAMDTRAHEAVDACSEAGLRIPHDVAILGVDNDELICNGSIPSLSSMQRDTLTCGFLAAQALDRLMRSSCRGLRRLTYGVSRIVTRESTQTGLSTADAVAIRAREFIRINAGEPIAVPDIVRHAHVSRRLLELRFRAAYGLSLLDEIRNSRLERVRLLLTETDLSLSEICARCGYQTDIHLRREFKRRFGRTMREFRKSAARSLEPDARRPRPTKVLEKPHRVPVSYKP